MRLCKWVLVNILMLMSFNIYATHVCTVTTRDLIFTPFGISNSSGGFNGECESTTMTITCTGGGHTFVEIGLTSSPVSQIKSGNNYVSYALFKNPSCSSSWTSTNTEKMNVVADGSPKPFVVYGYIPAQTTKPVGIYLGNVNINLNY